MKKIIALLFVIGMLASTYANSWSQPSTVTTFTMESADDGKTYFRIYSADFTTNGNQTTIKWFGFLVNDMYKQAMADQIIAAKNASKKIRIRYNSYTYLNYTTFGTAYTNQIHPMAGFDVQ